jgi:hypothetical protein
MALCDNDHTHALIPYAGDPDLAGSSQLRVNNRRLLL